MRGRAVVLGAIVVAVTAILVWRAATRPLVTDEVEFVQTSAALVRSGQPLACDGPGEQVVLHHPQGYHLVLGATLLACGDDTSALAARLPGIMSLLLALTLTCLLARRLADSEAHAAGAAAVALVLASPLAIQGSLVVDIDNTVLVPALLAFLLLLTNLVESETPTVVRIATLGVSFAGLLWIKLPTPFLAIAAMAVVGLLTPGRRRLVPEALAAAAVGTLIFALSWWIFCAALELDPMAPLHHLAGRGAARASLTLAVLFKRSLRLAVWLGPWLPLTAFVASRQFLRGRESGARVSGPIVMVFAALVLVGYLVVGGEAFGFTRYHVPVVPVLAALGGTVLGDAWARAGRGALIGASLAAAMLLLAGDPLLPWYTLREGAAAGDTSMSAGAMVVIVSSVVWLAPVVLVVIGRRWGVSGAHAMAILALVAGSVVSVHQLTADYSTNYLYGERSMGEAVRHLADIGPDQGLVIVPKDLGFASLPCGSYRFASRSLSRGEVRPAIEQGELRVLAIRRGHLADHTVAAELWDPVVQGALSSSFSRTRIGDFIFYELVQRP